MIAVLLETAIGLIPALLALACILGICTMGNSNDS